MSLYAPLNDYIDPTVTYSVMLLTDCNLWSHVSDPGVSEPLDANTLVQVSDSSYAPAETSVDKIETETNLMIGRLYPVTFSGQAYTATYTVCGAAVVMNTSIGVPMIVAMDIWNEPVFIGPDTDDLIVFAEVYYTDMSELSNMDWN